MKRLTRELAEAEVQITAAKATTKDVEATLDRALAAARHCERAYLTAPDHIRRQINQGFFVKLFIGEDGSVERAELTEPFAALLEDGRVIQAVREMDGQDVTTNAQDGPGAPDPDETNEDATNRVRPSGVLLATLGETMAVTLRTHSTTPRTISRAGRGVNEDYMVELRGFEPLTPTLPVWCATSCATAPCDGVNSSLSALYGT